MPIVHLLILSLAALAAAPLRADEGPDANPLLESRVYLQVSPSGRAAPIMNWPRATGLSQCRSRMR